MNPQQETVKIAIKKLFDQSYFSITNFDDLLKITNSICDSKTHDLLHAIHCVHYDKMTPEYRKWLFQTVTKTLCGNGFPLEIIDRLVLSDGGKIIDITPVQAPEKSGLRKMLGL